MRCQRIHTNSVTLKHVLHDIRAAYKSRREPTPRDGSGVIICDGWSSHAVQFRLPVLCALVAIMCCKDNHTQFADALAGIESPRLLDKTLGISTNAMTGQVLPG